ncbi:hypothetical protein DH2020_015098 [Rehmannia glutinosa]|uniref:E3 ubiquitin-protein ligase n=1 Tax=Rehmannia glutinosa TaxID=99300 RepID=A0ABR0WZS7_REHGL
MDETLGFCARDEHQKRETGSHIEDENENVHLPFVLCHSISNILSLLVAGAFSVSSNDDTGEETFFSTYRLDCEDQDSLRHAKVGRLSQESSVSSITGKNALDLGAKAADSFPVPSSALWLIYECLRSIENWLGLDNTLGPLSALSLKTSDGSGNNFLALKRTLSRFRRARYMFKSSSSSDSKSTISSEAHSKPSHGGLNIGLGSECSQSIGQAAPGGSDENILEGESTCELEGLRVLSLSDWPDITYDVSSQEISVHIPLHRLLSMVLRRELKECYGESVSSYVLSACSADRSFVRYGDFFAQILDGCHPYGFSAFVMEHPLQIRVFCAQVHAGMWRRNGDAPILFSEWYRSVRWSEQGQELDLFLLQCCAALAPPDLYVQRILERFGLSNYLSLNLEQSSEHESLLVAEMLALLIQIVKERRFCGLTTAECLQRELVYKLSIGDATRSQLVKSLPRDLSKVDELQEVLDKVAEYSHPSGMTQGMYKLRSSYWKELDLYHPRWNLRDQQAAEERYLRFSHYITCSDGVLLTALHLLALALDVCRLHKESGDPLCYVGDVIPILAFAGEEICMSKYGDQSILSLLVLLMRMHEKEAAQNFMEAGNFNLSSLISSLLKTFVELEPGCMTKLQKLAPQLANQFSHSIINDNARDSDLTSDSEKRKAKSRERQAAILEKMRAQQSKFLESFNSNQDDEMDDTKSEQEVCDSEVSNDTQESSQVICSLCHDPKSKRPVSFLVLLQTSISGGSEMVSVSQLEGLVQSAVNDFASTGQPHEVNAFMELIKARFPSIKNVNLPCMPKDTKERISYSLETFEEHLYLLIRECQSSLSGSDSLKDEEKCSTAGSSKERSGTDESLLLGKYIAALPKEPQDSPSASENGHSSSYKMKSESSILRPGSDDFGPSGANGIYVSSCGHAVHQGCLDRYLSSLRERYIRRIVFEGGHIVDPDQPFNLVRQRWFLRLLDALSLLKRAANIAGSSESLKALPTRNVKLKPNLEPIIRLLCGMYYPGQDKIIETGRMSHSLILWDTLKYSLISAEIAARSGKSSLSPNYSLGALYKELNSSSCFILSLLLDVIQSTRTSNSQTVLLRFQGIQLFARSLCSSTYPNELSSYSNWQGGNMLYILENAEPEVRYPDIQLWRRASEPILARDAFSSFMWILFCLPWPILSCKESYLSLVHVFYVVTVTQAIIAYHKENQSTETELGLFFEPYSVNPAYDIKSAIRSLTFPYLRRCALLWKLINCSNMKPFGDVVHSWDGSPYASDLEYTTNFVEELPEVEKLESMFKIPPLDLIVNDEEDLLQRTTILLQRSARQAPWPSPYLDAFGEEGVEMNRGKPLYLNEERYAALTHMIGWGKNCPRIGCGLASSILNAMFGDLVFIGGRVLNSQWLLMGLIGVQRWYRLHKGSQGKLEWGLSKKNGEAKTVFSCE